MARYVLLALMEVDEEARLLAPVLTDDNGEMFADADRDITDMEGRVPFLRFGLVDRARRNRVVFSSYSFLKTMEAFNRFNTVDSLKPETSMVVTEAAKTLEA